MPAIDLKEIPEAHVSSGEQDSFELFSAELLELMGYEIVDRPGRGADLGKDLLAIERRKGIGRETLVRWLVSCKHKTVSGRAVGLEDEQNLVERVEGHGCSGFLGVYSTLPSASLLTRLNQLKPRFEHLILDRAAIERVLLQSEGGLQLARRYCPLSAEQWTREHPTPAEVFGDSGPLLCAHCGRDLLNPPQGIFAVWRVITDHPKVSEEYVDVHWACKGHCDRIVEDELRARHGRPLADAWEDIPDFCVPLIYIRRVMAFINGLHAGDKWSEPAFEKMKDLIVNVYPYVARHTTTIEEQRIKRLMWIPAYMGGLGDESD